LKIPPALNPFYSPLGINTTYSLFRLLRKYKPETRSSKCARLKALSEAIISKKVPSSSPKPVVLKFGLKHVTSLVEKGLAKLVVIAWDVDPIELVVWLPSLCEAMSVPYCIIKNKDRLGKLTGTKTCTTIALTEVRQEDQSDFDQLVLEINKYFTNDTYLKRWKYPEMGFKRSEKLRIIHEELYKQWSIKYSIEF
jgi:large subunit ribosomal protein L7Ae